MPVLNESMNLRESLQKLHLSDDEELIVVDGGSTDGTMSIARDFTDMVFQTETGRARVMNYGAARASGEILLFLHADCVLPDNAFRQIRDTLQEGRYVAGGFHLAIDHPGMSFRLIEFGANLRSFLSSLLYGDQGIFLKKNTFDKIGGYADIPLMEDIEIINRLKKIGPIAFLRSAVHASPRRWLEEGALYTTMRDWTIALSYTFFSVSPSKLIRYYRDVR